MGLQVRLVLRGVDRCLVLLRHELRVQLQERRDLFLRVLRFEIDFEPEGIVLIGEEFELEGTLAVRLVERGQLVELVLGFRDVGRESGRDGDRFDRRMRGGIGGRALVRRRVRAAQRLQVFDVLGPALLGFVGRFGLVFEVLREVVHGEPGHHGERADRSNGPREKGERGAAHQLQRGERVGSGRNAAGQRDERGDGSGGGDFAEDDRPRGHAGRHGEAFQRFLIERHRSHRVARRVDEGDEPLGLGLGLLQRILEIVREPLERAAERVAGGLRRAAHLDRERVENDPLRFGDVPGIEERLDDLFLRRSELDP